MARKIAGWDGAEARFASIYDGSPLSISGDALLLVGAREASDALERSLRERRATGGLPELQTIKAIGDCHVPGAIYNAVYSGHRAAREFGETIDPDAVGYIRERVTLAARRQA
jgi:dimethylamine/trimethylamine dehydrogenase